MNLRLLPVITKPDLRTLNDFLYLTREFNEEDLSNLTREGLITIVQGLKTQSLDYLVRKNKAYTALDGLLTSIESGVDTEGLVQEVIQILESDDSI